MYQQFYNRALLMSFKFGKNWPTKNPVHELKYSKVSQKV